MKTAYLNYHCKGYFGFIKVIIRGTKVGLNSAIIEWYPSKMDK